MGTASAVPVQIFAAVTVVTDAKTEVLAAYEEKPKLHKSSIKQTNLTPMEKAVLNTRGWGKNIFFIIFFFIV